MQYKSAIAIALFAATELVSGHGVIVRATGDAGGTARAIGVTDTVSRTGTGGAAQRDSTRFKGQNRAACGQTTGGGDNNVETGVKAVMDKAGGLPQVSPNGYVELTLHQVNGDGAGPYTCMVDPKGTGESWFPARVTENVPGRNGNSRARATDFPLRVSMPADIDSCSGEVGGMSNVCMVRCQNPARAGPFGGCVPIQMVDNANQRNVQANNNNNNANANANNNNNNANNNNANANRNVANNNRNRNNKRAVDIAASTVGKAATAEKQGQSAAQVVTYQPAAQVSAGEDLDNDPAFLAQLRSEGEEI